MDIWAWVEDFTEQLAKQGQQRLAYELLHLPSLVVDNRHDEVDRLVPSLLGAAREMEHRWLEVYVRHWNLQSRVLKRYEVRGLLPEAIDLLDFANQDDTKSCPQSICVVQDLANCYADTDGPAYGQERLDVAEETLGRIDPSWPCFRCISSEYASALVDLERPQEALDFCNQQLAAIGPTGNPYDFRDSKVEALMALGRLEEALAFNTKAENPGGGDSWIVHKTIDQARLLARLGRHDEAKEILPGFDAIIETPAYFRDWADAMQHLVSANHVANDWQLDLNLRVMAFRLEDNGALRDAWHLQHMRLNLALERQRPWVARHALEAMQRIAGELERPLDAPAKNEDAEQRVAAAEAATDVTVFDQPEANLDVDPQEPDLDYERLRRALDRWPNDKRLWLGWSRAAGVLGRASEIVARGRAFADTNPNAWEVAIVVGQTMVALDQIDEAEAWAEAVFGRVDNAESRASARFVQALAAERRGDLEGMRARLEEVIQHDPNARNSRAMLAELARSRGDHDVALEHLNVLVKIEPDVGSHHWGRIVAATLEDEWDTVRESAKAIGLELRSTEGPVEEEWGPCRLQLRDDTGTAFELYASRTGPVTARIIEISAPELRPQYFDAMVVFDPRPLNPPDPHAQQRASTDEPPSVLIFPLLDVLNASPFEAFAIDGVKPNDAQLESLQADLEQINVVMQIRSGTDYQISHQTKGTLPGAYWYVAVHADTPLDRLAARLEQLAAELDGPLVWPELAKQLEQTERLTAMQRDIEAWELM